MEEAAEHPHLAERATYADRGIGREPAPAPRFSRTSPTLATPPPARPGQDTREALAAWGIDDVQALLGSGAAVQT
jgi:alpha-methylacyl-CoA racemase